jgi:hypothetical protein
MASYINIDISHESSKPGTKHYAVALINALESEQAFNEFVLTNRDAPKYQHTIVRIDPSNHCKLYQYLEDLESDPLPMSPSTSYVVYVFSDMRDADTRNKTSISSNYSRPFTVPVL